MRLSSKGEGRAELSETGVRIERKTKRHKMRSQKSGEAFRKIFACADSSSDRLRVEFSGVIEMLRERSWLQ